MILKEKFNSRQKRLNDKQKAEHINFMLTRKEPYRLSVSEYSEYKQVSRQTLYNLLNKFQNAFKEKQKGPRKSDQSKQKYDDRFQQWLGNISKKISIGKQERVIRTVLQASVSPASTSDIKEIVRQSLSIKLSERKIKKIIKDFGAKAKKFLQCIPVEEHVQYLACDEVFSGKKPILTAVEQHSFAVVICEREKRRDSDAWLSALGSFVNLELVVSDQATGIEKAIKERMLVRHQFDLWHIKRDMGRLLRHIESQAYKKIEKEYKSEKKLKSCKSEETVARQRVVYENRIKDAKGVVSNWGRQN